MHTLTFLMVPSVLCTQVPGFSARPLPMDRTEDGDAETCRQPKLPGKFEDGAESFILILTVPGFQLRNSFCHLFFIMVIECNWKAVQWQVNLIPYHNTAGMCRSGQLGNLLLKHPLTFYINIP